MTNQKPNPKILVICGGYSTEREVSIKTGENIFQSLTRQGLEPAMLVLSDYKNEILEQITQTLKGINYDLVVNALHGEFGEDGHLQAILETLGVAYTGSAVLASSLGMDKARLYEILDKYGIRVPQTFILKKSFENTEKEALQSKLLLPVIIKPNDGGSSIGVTKVMDWGELDKALTYAFEGSNTAIIQEFISGVEITCPVINSVVLPVGEIQIDKSNSFFDYEAKYSSELTKEIFPANLPVEITEQTQKLALQIHKIIGASGLTRSDFIFNQESGEIVFLEINTSPGMTSASLCPKSALAYGWDFDKLIKEIIRVI